MGVKLNIFSVFYFSPKPYQPPSVLFQALIISSSFPRKNSLASQVSETILLISGLARKSNAMRGSSGFLKFFSSWQFIWIYWAYFFWQALPCFSYWFICSWDTSKVIFLVLKLIHFCSTFSTGSKKFVVSAVAFIFSLHI